MTSSCSRGEAVAVLHGRDGHDLPGALDLVDADAGEPDVADRAALDVVGDRAEALLERRFRVHAVQVVEADRLRAQRSHALLDLRRQHLGPPLAGPVAALRGDEHLVGRASERLPDGPFAVAAPVEVRRVDVAHARRHGLADEGHVLLRGGEAVRASRCESL